MAQHLGKNEIRRLACEFEHGCGTEYFYGPFLSSAIAGRDEPSMRAIMATALGDGIDRELIDEIVLQSHLFLGFPAMIEASRVFADISGRRYNTSDLPEAYTAAECVTWNVDGMAKIRQIYGPAFDRLVTYVNSFSPQILTWMINDGYGQVLSRPGASFQLRELSIVATLTVTCYSKQLGAHIRGALNVGADPSLIERIIGHCRYFCPDKYVQRALRILGEAVVK
jgi:4-carboxymuconolactone decarboxylase